jgi:hypothetical protein
VQQSVPRPKRPGTVTAVMVLMVIHGLLWLWAAWAGLGDGDLVAVLFVVGMAVVGGLSVCVPFGFAPGRSAARTAALVVTWLAIAVELMLLGFILYGSLNPSGCPPEGCEPIGGLLAAIAVLLLGPPLVLATATVLLLASRSAKNYLTNPRPF